MSKEVDVANETFATAASTAIARQKHAALCAVRMRSRQNKAAAAVVN